MRMSMQAEHTKGEKLYMRMNIHGVIQLRSTVDLTCMLT